ncbi:MAG: BACON domain-containing protein [Bacteroidales bacterium]|nr:BACON domain-containing protein [Bacteroidales bacterium]
MKKIVYILAAAALTLVACNGKQNPSSEGEKASEVKLSQESITAGPEGGAFEVTVTSSEPWRVAGFAEWVKVETAEGQSGSALKLTVDANEDTQSKTASFKVFAGSAAQTLVVVSNPSFELSLVSDSEVAVNSNANTIVVSVVSNASLEYALDADWLSLERVSTAFGKILYQFNVARSQAFKAREGKITFSGSDVEPVEVTVTQAQRDTAFVVEGAKIEKDLAAFDQTLQIRTNVENLSYSLPSWLSETSASDTEKDSDGLSTHTIQVHADACGGTRGATVSFRSGSATIGSVYVKQQNPNPVFAEIEDDALASVLESSGWILKDPETGKCEILEAGLTGTSLSVNNNSVVKLTGLGAFPELATLTIGTSCRALTHIATGASKVSAITLSSNHYFTSTELTISGDNVTSIAVPCSSWYIMYGYDKLATLDVTGCPKLATLNAQRQYNSSEGPLRTIYMTQAQSETVEVTKNPSAEIVVK